jgi:hypothetical protein
MMIVSVCLSFVTNLSAQVIIYQYDASGNRIKRNIVVTRSLQADTTLNKTVDSTEIYGDNAPEDANTALNVKVYPNPTYGIFEIEIEHLTEKQKPQLHIYTINGSLVKTVNRLQNRQSIDISDQPTGIYLLRITADDKVVTNKIIKQ